MSPKTSAPANKSLTKDGFDELKTYQCDKAIAYFARALANNQTGLSTKQGQRRVAQLLALIGTAFRFDENEVAVVQAMRFATTLNPDNKVYRAILAECLVRCSRLDESKELINGLNPNPDDSVIVQIAPVSRLIRQLDLSSAANTLNKVLATTHDTTTVSRCYLALAKTYAKQGLTTKAGSYFKLAAEHVASPYLASIYRGYTQQAKLDAEAASQCFKEAGKILPAESGLAKCPIRLLSKSITDDDRLRLRKQAVGCSRLSTLSLIGLAHLLKEKRDLKAALSCADYAEKLRPWSADVYALRARLLNCEPGSEAKAVSNFNIAITKQPDNANFYGQFAQYLLDNNKLGDAARIYWQGIKHCPRAENLWSGLSKISSKLGKWDDAKLYSGHALDCMPPNTDELNMLVQNEYARMHATCGTCDYKNKNLDASFEHAKAFNRYKFSPKLPPILTLMQMRPGPSRFLQQGEQQRRSQTYCRRRYAHGDTPIARRNQGI